jgi:putative peptide maturation system protein
MKEFSKVLETTLDFLLTLARDGIKPQEAKKMLSQLNGIAPTIDLVWDFEEFDQSVHYDALIRYADQGTVSLSFCSASSLPWPLRGVHRTKDGSLVTINNTSLRVEDAIRFLDLVWNETRIRDNLVKSCLIEEYLDNHPIEVSVAEIQEEMNAYRRANRLYSAEETHRWMDRQGLTHISFQRMMKEAARLLKLRNQVTKNNIGPYFEAHHRDFDRALINQIVFDDLVEAQYEYDRIKSGKTDLFSIAKQRFLTVTEPVPFFLTVNRRYGDKQYCQAIFDSSEGDLLDPIHTNGRYALVKVLGHKTAVMDQVVHDEIQLILFDDWLEKLRKNAHIVWHWGKEE